jgi:hypothetical protein
VTLGLVVAVALGTFGVFLADSAGWLAHLTEVGTGRWLTLVFAVSALVLAALHGARAGELTKR